MAASPVTADFLALIKDAINETGVELKVSAKALAGYAAEEAAKLALAIAEPGFPDVLRASRDNLALKAGIEASIEGDAADAHLLGLLQGGLALAARALVVA